MYIRYVHSNKSIRHDRFRLDGFKIGRGNKSPITIFPSVFSRSRRSNVVDSGAEYIAMRMNNKGTRLAPSRFSSSQYFSFALISCS